MTDSPLAELRAALHEATAADVADHKALSDEEWEGMSRGSDDYWD